MMIPLPAIDLIDGQCVRLEKGDYSRVTVFHDSPVEMARHWESLGAPWLHVVDLNGAKAGKPVHSALISDIIRSVKIPVQIGGGVRTLDSFRHYLDMGARRVILGSVCFRHPQVLEEALAFSAPSVIVSLDSIDGRIALEGWTEVSAVSDTESARTFQQMGVPHFIFTDISRDGTQSGIHLASIKRFLAESGVPIIVAGGVSTLEDIKALRQIASGIEGFILGKALYTGKITLPEVIALLEEEKREE